MTFTAGQKVRATDLQGAGLVDSSTSATRPATPGTGQRIYETDTLFYRRYDGTYWVYTGSNADPDTTTATVGHTPTYTATTSAQLLTHNATSTLSGWTGDRDDTAVVTYSSGTFTIVERGLYAITATVTSDGGAAGMASVSLNVPGGSQSFPGGAVTSKQERGSGYTGAGGLVQPLAWTGYCEAGWTFTISVFHFMSNADNINFGGSLSVVRLPS